MRKVAKKKNILIVLLAGSLIASLSGNLILWQARTELDTSLRSTQTEAASVSKTRDELADELRTASTTAAELAFELTALSEQYEKLKETLIAEQSKNEDFEDQIRSISKTVGTLDKLAKTDEELLQKYSKVYFLNENYVPSKLADIPEDYVLAGRQAQQFHADALPFLENMLNDASRDEIELKVLSAYRSFSEQAGLKGAYSQTYGSGANAFSADQGYSEHQLGTTVDLSDPETAGPYTSFKETPAYEWLLKNAHRHGFILSYPENNGYYIFEPWHWRFVGEDLATYLHENELNFYDLDQRTIDTYLVKLFD
jgi:D-alanyl-D-alanine carboxypeptidase